MELLREHVKYSFSPNEMVEIAKNQARYMNDKNREEETFDSIRQDHKGKVSRIESDITHCTRRITSGYEMREVECVVLKFRPEKGSAIVIRTDNGRVIRTRKLSEEEKQLKLSAEAPPDYAFEADLFEDGDSDILEQVADGVPFTEAEAEPLREVIDFRPMRPLIEDSNGQG